MEKKAINKHLLTTLIGSIGLPVGMDALQHDDLNFDKKRVGNLILNALIGAGSGSLLHTGIAKKNVGQLVGGANLAALAPAKDLLLNLQNTPDKLNSAADAVSEGSKLNRNIALGLGAGALGLGTLGVIKYLMSKDPKTDMGSLKLKLPGKKNEPGTDAEVSIPIDLPGMSPSLMEGLNRGVRLQARKNVKANSYKRDPETGKLIPMEEWEAKYKGQDMANAGSDIQKYASTREWAEGAGSIISSILGATAGTAIGGRMVDKNKGLAALAGGVIGAFTPAMLAKAISAVVGARTDTDQFKHDSKNAFGEYLIPGYADFQQEQRKNQKEDENKLSFANTLSSDAAFRNPGEDDELYDYGDDYDMDKFAAMQPPPPPMGVPQGPPPIDKKRARPVMPQETPPASPETRFMSTGKATTPMGQAHKAHMAVNQALSKLQTKKASSPYTIELYYMPEDGVKQASAIDMSAREEARDIMKKIYDEDPSYWPYGLDIPGHESLYIVRDNMTKAAAGFVGWQEIVDHGKKVGSYSIGILPEYRNKGFAKEAVAKVLRIKSAGVDEVRAYIMKHNGPSHKLADSLGVKIQEKF